MVASHALAPTLTHIHTCIHTHEHIYTHIRIHAHTYMYAHTDMSAHTPAPTHRFVIAFTPRTAVEINHGAPAVQSPGGVEIEECAQFNCERMRHCPPVTTHRNTPL